MKNTSLGGFRGLFSGEASVRKVLVKLVNGTILAQDDFLRLLPFLLYASFLALVYISNSYYAESTARNIRTAEKGLKELRYEFISTKSDLMFLSKQSEVAKRLSEYGVKESLTPAVKLYKQERTN